MVTTAQELYKTRNYVGQTEQDRRSLEKKLKSRYEISDWEDSKQVTLDNAPMGVGYKIHDTQTGQDYHFSANSRLTLETRYLEKDVHRKPSENALDLFARVAVNIAEADLKYNSKTDITPVAQEFLETMLKQEFMPNTPTLCNAGRALQQLSACFVLPIEDYMATDDIGEDPEKQGNGIFDAQRYMSMIHKSGGGTGFNFGYLRPRTDRISTTFGSSSGPVSFAKSFDACTDAVNQGGFRRGANMGILPYYHPDIFEWVSVKARENNLTNFNLSVGIDDKFMSAVEKDDYFKLINPKDRNKLPEDKRIWKKENLLIKGEKGFKDLLVELGPSLYVDNDGVSVINGYNNQIVGKIGDDGSVLISARKLYDYIAENAWVEGCPGIVNLDMLERKNRTPNVGKIVATNPCGEQPLLPYEACDLGGINLATCVTENNGKVTVNYSELERRINIGVHFLDNVIDMSKFPFQKIYGAVHGTRKIGLGYMGFAEMLTKLNISYGSEESMQLAANLSRFITDKAVNASERLSETRGTFPYWEGSEDHKNGRKTRNAARTTIAPNGTTGMIADANGGIEPFFKLAYKKTCMDGKVLHYWAPGLVNDLTKVVPAEKLDEVLREVMTNGTLQHIDIIPSELKFKYITAHDLTPEQHIRMQAAFQNGENGVGIENAVSKTVNLSYESTVEDVKKAFTLSYQLGCVGTTVFRDKCKKGVYSGLETVVTKTIPKLLQNHVALSPILDVKSQAIKTKVSRNTNGDSLHITVTSDLYVDDKNNLAYFIPAELFQERSPLGAATSVSFAQSGMDRTELFKGEDPNYAEFVTRLQSASSNEEEGIGPRRIKSIEHAVGVALENVFLNNGIIGIDSSTNRLINLVRKKDLRKLSPGTEEYDNILKQVRVRGNSEEEPLTVTGNHGKLSKKFVCERCGSTDYTFEAGCHHPKCTNCGEYEGGGCG